MKLRSLALLGLVAALSAPAQAQVDPPLLGDPVDLTTSFIETDSLDMIRVEDQYIVAAELHSLFPGDEQYDRISYKIVEKDGSLPNLLWYSVMGGAIPNGEPTVGRIFSLGPDPAVIAWVRDGNVVCKLIEVGQSVGPMVTVADTAGPLRAPHMTRNGYLVWRDPVAGLRGARLGLNLADDLMVMSLFDVSSNGADTSPRLARSDEAGAAKLVVWRRGTQIVGRRWTGNSPSASDVEFVIHDAPGVDEPDCDMASPDDAVVVWAENGDTFLRRVAFPTPLSSVPQLGPIRKLDGDANQTESEPRIAFTGNAYLATYHDDRGPGQVFVEGKVVDAMGRSKLMTIPYGGPHDEIVDHALAAMDDPGVLDDQGFSIWMQPMPPGGDENDVTGQRSETRGGEIVVYDDAGCEPLGGEVRVNTAVGDNDGFRVELWFGEPQYPAYLIGNPSSFPVAFDEATLIPDAVGWVLFYAGFTDVDGYVGLNLPLKPGFVGSQFFLQWAQLGTPSGFLCTSQDLSLSDALALTVY